jgi:hypothetical protein
VFRPSTFADDSRTGSNSQYYLLPKVAMTGSA